MTDQKFIRNKHLYWRAAFGPSIDSLKTLQQKHSKELFRDLLQRSEAMPEPIDVMPEALKTMLKKVEDGGMRAVAGTSEEEKRMLRELSRDGIRDLNLSFLKEMVHSDQQLREKMAFFWHGHFACRSNNLLYQQQLLQIIRSNSLGNFGTLLREVSKSAAMLNFLNNSQNRKGHPNENFAREVMELFTMGRGNYTEQDIKEAARAFTGWNNIYNGQFVFRRQQHDDGTKTILNKTASFDGDQVLDLLLQQKQTAVYITRKLYKFLVNEQVDETQVTYLADRFYKSNYEITTLLKEIFEGEAFYDKKNIGAKIKSPIELIAGIQRMLPLEWKKPESQLFVQRLLGQALFYPPNVAGWPGGKTWIDSSTLMVRLRLPQLIYGLEELYMNPKDDDDQMMGMMAKNKATMGRIGGQQLHATIDWQKNLDYWRNTAREELTKAVGQTILQTADDIKDDVLLKSTDASSREAFIKTLTIQLMSTPEYQLC